MLGEEPLSSVHPAGDSVLLEGEWPVDTPGGQYYAEMDEEAPMTREGQLILRTVPAHGRALGSVPGKRAAVRV